MITHSDSSFASPVTVCVFCGSRAGRTPRYVKLATEFGHMIGSMGANLIYGAGAGGIMGAVASAAWKSGSMVTGVITEHLLEEEGPKDLPGEVLVVRDMHARKSLMYRLASAFAVLPGGLGTFDELMEIATWSQLGLHEKPIVVMNHEGYFDPFEMLLDHSLSEGFIDASDRRRIQLVDRVDDAMARLQFDLPGQVVAAAAPPTGSA